MRKISDIELIKIMADDQCYKILYQLQKGPSNPYSLQRDCDIPQTSFYRKIAILKQAGFITEKREKHFRLKNVFTNVTYFSNIKLLEIRLQDGIISTNYLLKQEIRA